MEEYGVSRTSHFCNSKLLAKTMGYKSMSELRFALKHKIITTNNVIDSISSTHFGKRGRPTKLLPDEEALAVAKSDLFGLAGQPCSIFNQSWEIGCILFVKLIILIFMQTFTCLLSCLILANRIDMDKS